MNFGFETENAAIRSTHPFGESYELNSSQDEVDVEIDLKTGNHKLRSQTLRSSKKKHRRQGPFELVSTQTPNTKMNEGKFTQSLKNISQSVPSSPYKG